MRVLARNLIAVIPIVVTACVTFAGDVDKIPGNDLDGGGLGGDAGGGGPSGVDAAASGADSGPDASGGFCAAAGAHALCDDFDVAPLGERWTDVVQASGGAVTLATGASASAPSALRATVPSGCSDSAAQLLRSFDARPARVFVGFAVLVSAAPPSEVLHLAGYTYPTAVGEYRLDIGFRKDRLEVAENDIGGASFSVKGSSSMTFPKDAWRRVVVELVYAPPPAKVIVKVDGVTQIDVPIAPREPSEPSGSLDFGLFASGGCTAPVEVRFDDVFVDFVAR